MLNDDDDDDAFEDAPMRNVRNELRSILSQLDNLADVWGDEGVFRRCRDRLRLVLTYTSQFVED